MNAAVREALSDMINHLRRGYLLVFSSCSIWKVPDRHDEEEREIAGLTTASPLVISHHKSPVLRGHL